MNDKIIVKGAREHNLKNVDVEIPRNSLTVMTGLSGSGKSSLAFDTIFADGQRRYMESLSSYARQFLGQMNKPDVDSITGLSPAISIDQKTTSKNPRSTVGTVTEIYDYLRLLYSRTGIPHCPICGREITMQTVDDITDTIMALEKGTKIQILSPIVRGRKGEHLKELEKVRRSGYARVRCDGNIYDLSEEIKLDKNKKHNVEIIVDRLVIKDGIQSRLAESLETAMNSANGLVMVDIINGETMLFSQNYACPEHNVSMEEMSPRMFSFNSPFGACETCTGLGVFQEIDIDKIIPDRNKSIADGGICASGWNSLGKNSIAMMYYNAIAKRYNISLDTPIKDLPQEVLDVFLYGTDEKLHIDVIESFGGGYRNSKFEGVVNNLKRRFTDRDFSNTDDLSKYMKEVTCPTCKGKRLKKEVLSVTVGGINIDELCHKSIGEALEFFENLKMNEKNTIIAERLVKEIKERLGFLKNVGLEYLSLARSSGTLSGGESQRIRLATQIGSYLTGVLYILDEPSIGLHQRDNDKLITTLKKLRDLGNTLIVVEHDEDTIMSADYVVDVGKGAGIYGGEIVFSGTPQELLQCESSITGQYLSGKKSIPVPTTRRLGNGNYLKIINAHANNLKNIDVTIPLGMMVCVTGVSGSGKSSLINQILAKHLLNVLNRANDTATDFDKIEGVQNLDKIIMIDQSPIGRTPRSNPATYTGVFSDIREIFAQTKDSKAKGYKANRFSFNVKGGRCEACQGDGIIKIEMHFLPDVYVPCEVCRGRRYNRETLDVHYKGKSIYDVLEMSIDEGVQFFSNVPKISKKLETLQQVGLGYIKIGQSATTLSGGEAQRVKLATELSKRSTGKTIYILDEPTTGLHSADVHKLINILQNLTDSGNSIVIIEHNLDVIKSCDYIIDLGAEGGDKGGEIVVTGTPEEVARCEKSYTGKYLKKLLDKTS
ncbi:MAG: excinuclease ABC subunit UvrA [Oscillospiraceae bacterium]